MPLLHIKYTSFVPCGCREDFFFMYFHYKSMALPIWTPGAPLAGFTKRSTISHQRGRFFLCLFHCKSMGANDPRGGAISVPRGMLGRIYVKLHITMLHTKYRRFGCCGFREDVFMYFPL